MCVGGNSKSPSPIHKAKIWLSKPQRDLSKSLWKYNNVQEIWFVSDWGNKAWGLRGTFLQRDLNSYHGDQSMNGAPESKSVITFYRIRTALSSLQAYHNNGIIILRRKSSVHFWCFLIIINVTLRYLLWLLVIDCAK